MDLSLVSCSKRASMHATLPIDRCCKSNTFSCRASQLSVGKRTNFYKVLALDSEDVGVDAIKKAFRSMALRYHPDVCPSSMREESTQMFIELQRAYETLSDPVMREKHDYELGLIGSGDGEKIRRRQRREESTRYPRHVWMNQLNELNVRSAKRMARKKKECM